MSFSLTAVKIGIDLIDWPKTWLNSLMVGGSPAALILMTVSFEAVFGR